LMRFRLPIRTFAPARLISRLSVRARIIAIAFIPVVGFLANGGAFGVGEHEVPRAFTSATNAADVSDASREFKVALTAMRMAAKEFAAQPSYDLVKTFAIANDDAQRSLDTIAAADDLDRNAYIKELQTKVLTLKSNFSSL